MVEIIELSPSGTLTLPAEIAARFRPTDRFVVWAEGDVLYLKRISSQHVSDILDEAPSDDEMSPEEVSEVVHEVRRRRRAG